jgi:hypothetical protein
MLSKRPIVACAFALAAAVAAYECIPRDVDVGVISAGEVSEGPGGTVTEHYLVTDQGRISVVSAPQIRLRPHADQMPRATCTRSINLQLHSYLHDCHLR